MLRRFLFILLLPACFGVVFAVHAVHAVDARAGGRTLGAISITGTVSFQGEPVCTLILANGEYTFTCDGSGGFSLTVLPDVQNQITLYCFCDGMQPYKEVLDASDAGAFSRDIELTRPQAAASQLRVSWSKKDEGDRYTLSGTLTFSDGTAVTGLVLAGGEHTFSDESGLFDLTCPADAQGIIPLQAFVEGAAPYKESIYTDPQAGCLAFGGTVTQAICCKATSDFPNLCLVGACGCAPEHSHPVSICSCPEGKCFNGSSCVDSPFFP